MRKLLTIGLFLCGLIQGVFSQDFHYSTRNYTAVDGLPQSQVSVLLEDRNGYLWMGTFGGGLARFDGREFKVYTTLDGLLANDITGLLFDSSENLWILHRQGVTRFDGLNFKKFETKEPSVSKAWFKRMYLQQDTIFLMSTQGTLSTIYNDSLYTSEEPILKDKQIIRLHLTQAGEACFFFSDGAILIQSGKQKFSIRSDVEMGKVFNVFNWKGNVLIRTESGLFKLDIEQRQLQKFLLGFSIQNFVLLYDESKDAFWTRNGTTLLRETFRNGVLKRDTVLRDIAINQVLIDSEENTWFASDGHGLYKYFIQDFDRCSPEELQSVMAVLKDEEGAKWIGTMTKGLFKIENGKIKSYIDHERSYRNSIHAIKQAPNGDIWVGTRGGLGKYNRGKESFEWIPLADDLPWYSANCIDFDNQGGMWIGTDMGLVYFKEKSKEQFPSNYAFSIIYSKKYKTLFIGSDVGLKQVVNKKVSQIYIQGFGNTTVLSVNLYRDSLVVAGTAGAGLVFFNPANSRSRFITTREGLASDFIYFVTPDEEGYLWVGTEKGINRIMLNTNFEIIENLHYGYDNGLTGVETNHNAFDVSHNGKYFGLVDGLYEFNDLHREEKHPFELHLTDVKILYGEYQTRDYADSVYGFFKIPYCPSLPPDKNHITFYFNRVNKLYPKSVKFKYFLENFDKAWSPPSSMEQVTYGNLLPGDYVFRVMASNNQGSWADSKIAYAFTVKSPFYRQASFIIGLFILVSGVITLVLYLRVKQRIKNAVQVERIRVKEQESLRKEIARDFHDEMGNQLTRIINYVSLLKLNGQSGFNHDELYSKVEDSAKYLYAGTRDFIWAIDPVNDELSKLFIHIRDFGEKLFEEKNIKFRAFNEVKGKIKLPYGFSREANLIYKETMTNAFKYSEAKNVTLSLKHQDDLFELIFEDDGIGFRTRDIENSNGLKNIHERADRINAILRISSEAQMGTKISLTFKLNQTKILKYGFTF